MPRRPPKPQPKKIDTADAVKRTARTGIQASAAVLVIVQGVNLFVKPPLSPEQTQWLTVAGTMLVSLIMNIIEEWSGHGLFKGKPEPIDELVTTLTPRQMLFTAEYLTARALREGANPEDPEHISPRQLAPEEVPFRG